MSSSPHALAETPTAGWRARLRAAGLQPGLTVSPALYARIAFLALVMLTLIVMTGAAVRLTGSGLGCPDWPKCYGRAYPPLETHALIEFGNRAITGLVGLAAVAAALLAWRRRPYRRDLALLGALLPLGVMGQAVLGGFTVRGNLDYGFVMAHFALSMLILVAAATLAWRARHEPETLPVGDDRRAVWAARALLPVGALTVFAGTAATAASPHAGGKPGQHINRLDVRGHGTLDWVIHQHGVVASVLGAGAVGLWLWLRRRPERRPLRRAVGALCGLLVLQGAVGGLQYATHLPAEIVWVHVALAALTWLALVLTAAAAGRLPRAGGGVDGFASPGGHASA
jgi:cytochrome c oxidase assembly protein subunit 15